MSKAAAWIMNVDKDLYVSVSQLELVHILDKPLCMRIPQAPSYCNSTLIWNDNLLPVMDISRLLGHQARNRAHDVVAVTLYKDRNGKHQYGGIRQMVSPELEYVTNDQICPLPGHFNGLRPATVSCFFSEKGQSVPILDMSSLFSLDYAETLASQ